MENLSRHERQELKKQEREQQREHSEQQKSSKDQTKKIIMWSVGGLAAIVVMISIVMIP